MKKMLITILLVFLTGCTQTEINLGVDKRLEAINNIQDIIQVGEIEKEIAFTDDNTGESFIIKVDAPKYTTYGGDIEMYFSITLTDGKDQDAYSFWSLPEGMYVRSLGKFNGNEIKYHTIPATATTTEQSIPFKVPVWENIEFDTSIDISKTKVIRKNTLGRDIDKVFKDSFKVGITNYYKAITRMPLEVVDEEWFIETIGDNYGHLDPNSWTFEDYFNSYNDASLSGQGDWTGDTTAAVSGSDTPFEGAKHVNQTAYARTLNYFGSSITSGTMYFAVKVKSAGLSYFEVNDGTVYANASIYLQGDNTITLYDAGDSAWESIGNYNDLEYYQIGISVEWGAGGWDCNGECDAISAGNFRGNVNDGTWSDEKEMENYGSESYTKGVSIYYPGFYDTIGATYYTPPVDDPCEYSGTGDWNVYYSDNCTITADVYVNGVCYFINDGAGYFGLQADVSCDGKKEVGYGFYMDKLYGSNIIIRY